MKEYYTGFYIDHVWNAFRAKIEAERQARLKLIETARDAWPEMGAE